MRNHLVLAATLLTASLSAQTITSTAVTKGDFGVFALKTVKSLPDKTTLTSPARLYASEVDQKNRLWARAQTHVSYRGYYANMSEYGYGSNGGVGGSGIWV